MRYQLLAVTLALAAALSGCARPPLECEAIVPSVTRSLPFDALTPENGGAWIVDHFHIEAKSNGETSYPRRGPSWTWKDSERTYSLSYYDRTSEPKLSLYDLAQTPTLDDVVRCFGKPDYYRGVVADGGLHFDMWYTSRGLVFGYWQLTPTRSFKVTGDLQLGTSIIVVRPGTLEQIGRRVYPQLALQEEQTELLGNVRRWPASLSEITFTTTSGTQILGQ